MSAVNKQDVIDAICEAFSYAYCDNCENSALGEEWCDGCHRKYQNWKASKKAVEEALKKVPTVEERKKGKWIDIDPTGIYHQYYECSACGVGRFNYGEDNFCPACGADMRESNGSN